MLLRPPGATRTDTLVPSTTLFRSDVVLVFVGQAGGRNAAAAPVDAFVVGQRAAYGDHGMNRVFVDILDHQHNPAVVQQKLVAGMAIFDQAGVVDADDG